MSYDPKWGGYERIDETLVENYAQEVKRLEAENARFQQWVDDLQSGLFINCVYCGHQYGPGDGQPTPRAALEKHIAECPKHPLSAAREHISRLEAAIEEGHKMRCGCRDIWNGREYTRMCDPACLSWREKMRKGK